MFDPCRKSQCRFYPLCNASCPPGSGQCTIAATSTNVSQWVMLVMTRSCTYYKYMSINIFRQVNLNLCIVCLIQWMIYILSNCNIKNTSIESKISHTVYTFPNWKNSPRPNCIDPELRDLETNIPECKLMNRGPNLSFLPSVVVLSCHTQVPCSECIITTEGCSLTSRYLPDTPTPCSLQARQSYVQTRFGFSEPICFRFALFLSGWGQWSCGNKTETVIGWHEVDGRDD